MSFLVISKFFICFADFYVNNSNFSLYCLACDSMRQTILKAFPNINFLVWLASNVFR